MDAKHLTEDADVTVTVVVITAAVILQVLAATAASGLFFYYSSAAAWVAAVQAVDATVDASIILKQEAKASCF